jgi:hypothetical protein
MRILYLPPAWNSAASGLLLMAESRNGPRTNRRMGIRLRGSLSRLPLRVSRLAARHVRASRVRHPLLGQWPVSSGKGVRLFGNAALQI